jgi:hypothetical protein
MQRLAVTPPKSVEAEGTLIRFIGKELIWFRGGSSALGKKGFDTVLALQGHPAGQATSGVTARLHFDKDNMHADQNWLKLIDITGKTLPVPLVFNGSTRKLDVRIQINTISKLHNNAAFYVEFVMVGAEHISVRTDPIVIKTKACSNGPNCSIQVSNAAKPGLALGSTDLALLEFNPGSVACAGAAPYGI